MSGWLARWFSARAKGGGGATDLLEVNYFEAGLLSSAEVVEFVTEIEQKFGIQFSDSDLNDERFVTISGLSELIEQHLRPARAPVAADGK